MPGKRSSTDLAALVTFVVALVWATASGASEARAEHGLPHFNGSFFSTQAAFGFAKPIGMAVAPGGRLFITDDAGIVKTSAAPNGEKATELFDLSEHVNEVQDRGLISVAVDKGYGVTNRSIYLAYTFEDRTPGELAAEPTLSELPKTQRLVRVEVPLVLPPPGEPIVLEPEDTDGDPANDEEVILGAYSSDPSKPGVPFSEDHACPQPEDFVEGDWSTANESDCIPSDSHEHTIDSVQVDPGDGTLWVSVGDGASGASSVDPRSWRSQREESYAGKLLHVDIDGNGLPGHPFCPGEEDLTKTCAKVYAKGFRNPFRFFLRPAPDGRPVVADAGWETREEIDLAEPGENYGWPCREGSIPTPTWSEKPECEALPAEGFAEPLYDYPQITDGAVIGGITYDGKVGEDSSIEYPAEYKGAIFFNDYGNLRTWYLRLDEAGTGIAPGYPKVFADDLLAVDWVTAPNGELMYVDIGFGPSGQAQVRKISFDPDNAAPEATATADKTFGPEPLTVKFDASGSTDPDGDELDYAWDLDGDGETDDSSAVEPEKTYGDENVTVTLRVDDGHGHQDTDIIEIFSGNEGPPEPEFTDGPTTYRDGTHLEFEGAAGDPDDGQLDPSALSWDVVLDHDGSHIHPWREVHESDSVGFTTDKAHDAPSTYIVELTATDSDGLSATETRVLNPETRTVRIEGIPEGGPIVYGGEDRTTPYEKESTIGVEVTISAAPEFVHEEELFTFDGWLDGAPRIRDLVVPDEDVTLTASYSGPEPEPEPESDEGSEAEPAPPAGPVVTPPPPPPVDAAGPVLFFHPKRGVLQRRKATLWGIVRDPSGVRRVLVGLRALRKQRGRCRWWVQGRGGFAKRRRGCRHPIYMRARLVGAGVRKRWVLPLRGTLPPGRYVLFLRALDAAGNWGLGPRGKRAVFLRVRDARSKARHRHDRAHQRANH